MAAQCTCGRVCRASWPCASLHKQRCCKAQAWLPQLWVRTSFLMINAINTKASLRQLAVVANPCLADPTLVELALDPLGSHSVHISDLAVVAHTVKVLTTVALQHILQLYAVWAKVLPTWDTVDLLASLEIIPADHRLALRACHPAALFATELLLASEADLEAAATENLSASFAIR